MNRYAVNGIELDVVEAGDPAGPAIVGDRDALSCSPVVTLSAPGR